SEGNQENRGHGSVDSRTTDLTHNTSHVINTIGATAANYNKTSTFASVLRCSHETSQKKRKGDRNSSLSNLCEPLQNIDSQSSTDSDSPLEQSCIRPNTASTAIYIRGIPYLPIHDVKHMLAQRPVCIQIRHIRNISWIDRTMVELLVDENHVKQMRNRISKNPDYRVRTSFDPLAANSYNWETEVVPETQEAILKEDFVNRISASMASSHTDSTRRYLMEWGRKRGVGKQLESTLAKRYKILPPENPFPSNLSGAPTVPPYKQSKLEAIPFDVPGSAKRFASHKRRYPGTDSIERFVRYQLVYNSDL
ncbi:hypothetical protein HOY82DRAFT_544416, partial [Tuber indicum]